MQIRLKQCKILHGILLSVFVCACVKVTQLCLTLCNPMDCSLPGSSVHGILQARILEWVAISFSRRSSQLRDRKHVSCVSGISRWILYHCATREAHKYTGRVTNIFPRTSWNKRKKKLVGVWEDVKQTVRRFVKGTTRSLSFICNEHPQRSGWSVRMWREFFCAFMRNHVLLITRSFQTLFLSSQHPSHDVL